MDVSRSMAETVVAATRATEAERPTRPEMATTEGVETMRDQHRSEVEGAVAAAAHRSAFPHDKRTARMLGKSRRTINRWANSGPPAARDFAEYARRAPNCEQLDAFARAAVLGGTIRPLPRAQLIRRLREALLAESQREADDRVHEFDGSPWQRRAEDAMRDGANDLLKAAIFIEFEVRYRSDPAAYDPCVIDGEVRRAH